MVAYRHLGRSGLNVTEITYGNWLTHGSQVENDTAKACVHAALDAGITTFDTADVYANTAAETVLGEALDGERRDGLEIFTKVFWPTGPKGANDSGLSRKHIMEVDRRFADPAAAPTTSTSTRRTATTRDAARGDHAGVRRRGASGKALYIGVSEWTAEQLREGVALARELHIPLVSNQPQYSMLWRVIEGRSSRRARSWACPRSSGRRWRRAC